MSVHIETQDKPWPVVVTNENIKRKFQITSLDGIQSSFRQIIFKALPRPDMNCLLENLITAYSFCLCTNPEWDCLFGETSTLSPLNRCKCIEISLRFVCTGCCLLCCQRFYWCLSWSSSDLNRILVWVDYFSVCLVLLSLPDSVSWHSAVKVVWCANSAHWRSCKAQLFWFLLRKLQEVTVLCWRGRFIFKKWSKRRFRELSFENFYKTKKHAAYIPILWLSPAEFILM